MSTKTTKIDRKTKMKRLRAKIKADDLRCQKANAKSYAAFANTLPAFIQQFPRIEAEIVRNYLTRENRYMVQREG